MRRIVAVSLGVACTGCLDGRGRAPWIQPAQPYGMSVDSLAETARRSLTGMGYRVEHSRGDSASVEMTVVKGGSVAQVLGRKSTVRVRIERDSIGMGALRMTVTPSPAGPRTFLTFDRTTPPTARGPFPGQRVRLATGSGYQLTGQLLSRTDEALVVSGRDGQHRVGVGEIQTVALSRGRESHRNLPYVAGWLVGGVLGAKLGVTLCTSGPSSGEGCGFAMIPGFAVGSMVGGVAGLVVGQRITSDVWSPLPWNASPPPRSP